MCRDPVISDNSAAEQSTSNTFNHNTDQTVPYIEIDNEEHDIAMSNEQNHQSVPSSSILSPKSNARQRQRKKRSLDSVINVLSEKLDPSFIFETVNDIASMHHEDFEHMTSDAFIEYLISIRNNDKSFVILLKDSFGDKLDNPQFFNWLSKKLLFKFPSYLQRKIERWENNSMKEARGRDSLSLEDRQFVYNL
eukprot:TCONS_00035954-protein